jgi:dipeptidase E
MKLLLTSGGLTNKSIAEALFDLVGKKPEETSLVFVPTASNVEGGDKGWVIDDLVNIQKQNFKQIEIADISAVPKEIWLPKFEEADVLFFEGGNTYHLMREMNRTGLSEILPELLKTKVYVGLSAGSMVACPDLQLKTSQIVYGEDLEETENMEALGLVNFYVTPHLNSPYFKNIRKDNEDIKKALEGVSQKVYILDDNSAVKVVGGKDEIISEGEYLVFNE